MKTLTLLLLLLPLLAIENTLTPSDTKQKMRVKVEVTSKYMEDTIKSFLHRELRSLGDVEIFYGDVDIFDTDRMPDYTIHIVHIKTSTVNGTFNGHALSVVTTSAIAPYSYALDLYRGHKLYVMDTEGLRNTCEQIVTWFDSSDLESSRKMDQVIKNVR